MCPPPCYIVIKYVGLIRVKGILNWLSIFDMPLITDMSKNDQLHQETIVEDFLNKRYLLIEYRFQGGQMSFFPHSGPYTYYVITLGGGGHQNDYILHENFCITNFQSS